MSTPGRVWVTGQQAAADRLYGNIVGQALPTVTMPQVHLDAFADLTASLTAFGERVATEVRRMTEGVRAAYRSLPRAVRRGRHHRSSRDRASRHWPGTDAVCPDHPARVIYRHLVADTVTTAAGSPDLARQRAAQVERALARCGDADTRALADAVPASDLPVSTHEQSCTDMTSDVTTHRELAPDDPSTSLLVAVIASRNAPADGPAALTYDLTAMVRTQT